MEIQRVSDSSLKIKSKNTSFLFDPQGKIDGEVVVYADAPSDYSSIPASLVISGPGEYEVAGVSIKGEKRGVKIAYDFLEESQNILVVSASSLPEIKETGDYTAIVIIADQAIGESLTEVAADVIILASPEEFLPQDRAQFVKADKVNLKKTEEYKGFIVHLSK